MLGTGLVHADEGPKRIEDLVYVARLGRVTDIGRYPLNSASRSTCPLISRSDSVKRPFSIPRNAGGRARNLYAGLDADGLSYAQNALGMRTVSQCVPYTNLSTVQIA